MLKFIQYPKCTTCKRAEKFLKENNVPYENRHIVEANPTKDELLQWMDQSDLEPKKFFNTSGNLYKEMKLKDKVATMTKVEMAELLATNGMLVKRPLVITDAKILVGFKEDAYKELI